MKLFALALASAFLGTIYYAGRRALPFDFDGLTFTLGEIARELFDAFERDGS